MFDEEQVSHLIDDIYDAALDAALWPRALERIYGFVGGSAAGLHVRDTARRTGQIFYEIATDPGCGKPHFEKYIKFYPLSKAYLVLEVGESGPPA